MSYFNFVIAEKMALYVYKPQFVPINRMEGCICRMVINELAANNVRMAEWAIHMEVFQASEKQPCFRLQQGFIQAQSRSVSLKKTR